MSISKIMAFVYCFTIALHQMRAKDQCSAAVRDDMCMTTVCDRIVCNVTDKTWTNDGANGYYMNFSFPCIKLASLFHDGESNIRLMVISTEVQCSYSFHNNMTCNQTSDCVTSLTIVSPEGSNLISITRIEFVLGSSPTTEDVEMSSTPIQTPPRTTEKSITESISTKSDVTSQIINTQTPPYTTEKSITESARTQSDVTSHVTQSPPYTTERSITDITSIITQTPPSTTEKPTTITPRGNTSAIIGVSTVIACLLFVIAVAIIGLVLVLLYKRKPSPFSLPSSAPLNHTDLTTSTGDYENISSMMHTTPRLPDMSARSPVISAVTLHEKDQDFVTPTDWMQGENMTNPFYESIRDATEKYPLVESTSEPDCGSDTHCRPVLPQDRTQGESMSAGDMDTMPMPPAIEEEEEKNEDFLYSLSSENSFTAEVLSFNGESIPDDLYATIEEGDITHSQYNLLGHDPSLAGLRNT